MQVCALTKESGHDRQCMGDGTLRRVEGNACLRLDLYDGREELGRSSSRVSIAWPVHKRIAGITEIPGQPARQWQLQDVRPHDSYPIAIALEGAAISCKWLFQELAHDRTRLTQRVTLQGKNASLYQEDVQRTFAATLAPGMSRIATAIGKAYERDRLRCEQT
jgi:hypothetical protein